MKVINIIITMLYAMGVIYTGYMAVTHLFVYFANKNMGHEESFRLPGLYLFGCFLFIICAFVGWRLYNSGNAGIPEKLLFYLPLVLVIAYALWAVVLLISSGGKWN